MKVESQPGYFVSDFARVYLLLGAAVVVPQAEAAMINIFSQAFALWYLLGGFKFQCGCLRKSFGFGEAG